VADVKRWFLPSTPDLIGLLREQSAITVRGLDAFVEWSEGNAEAQERVRDLEHEADDARRKLVTELRNAFSTPFDPEDVYELSERLDAVLNGAKNAVREADVMGMRPDDALADMARNLRDGVRHLDQAFAHLSGDHDDATEEADAAIRCEREVEHRYRDAMSELTQSEDVREVAARRELYRRYARIGEALVRVAHRVWYLVVKET
jgi:uncharacterized protein Yka (UPF0111/DUF47 family)